MTLKGLITQLHKYLVKIDDFEQSEMTIIVEQKEFFKSLTGKPLAGLASL